MSQFTIALSVILFMTPVISAEAQDTNIDNGKQPIVFWASDPVQPDETVMLMGGFFHSDAKVLIRRSENMTDAEDDMNDWAVITPLQLNEQTIVKLSHKTGEDIVMPAKKASCYALYVDLPEDLELGEYAISVHNGLGGKTAWSMAKVFIINKPAQWSKKVFDVKKMGFESALKSAKENGGGVIYFPRGRYKMEGQIELPLYTVLNGEDMGLVSLYWSDMDDPPPSLITGKIFGIQDISIYCQNYKNVISDSVDSEGVFIQRVRIRANALFMQMEPGGNFRERQAIKSHLETYSALRLVGKNFKITDCDIYASNLAIALDPHSFTKSGPRFGLIARNTPNAHTAYIERMNGTFRSRITALVRRGRSPVRQLATLHHAMYLVGTVYNFCVPHKSLRRELYVTDTSHRWIPMTPAMVIGITDHVLFFRYSVERDWTVRELLSYQVPLPPWKLPRGRPSERIKELINRWNL